MALTAKGQPGGLATLDADGDMPAAQVPAAAAVADVAGANADGTYDADTAALINELKTQVNAALAALRAAGLMEE
jgi:hypothetical protein